MSLSFHGFQWNKFLISIHCHYELIINGISVIIAIFIASELRENIFVGMTKKYVTNAVI